MKHPALPLLLLSLLLLAACAGPAQSTPAPPVESGNTAAPAEPVVPDPPHPAPEPDPRQEAIDALLASMTTEEKVGQLFFPRCPAAEQAEKIARYHLGGLSPLWPGFSGLSRELAHGGAVYRRHPVLSGRCRHSPADRCG